MAGNWALKTVLITNLAPPAADWHAPAAGGAVRVTHIFFLTSTWPSRRSYSFLILAFSCSSSCSFSRLNSCSGTGH